MNFKLKFKPMKDMFPIGDGVVKECSRNNAQSRWFATNDLTADGVAACGKDINVTVAVLATNDKRNDNGGSIRGEES